MDPEVVLSALTGYVSTGTRLLTAGADVDAIMSLRQAVSRKGVSVSMAWDSHQAQDLLAIIKPEVAVIDLDLPPRDGYRLVAGFADLDPVPSAVLISKRTDGADRFAAEAADRSRAHRLITFHDLLGNTLKSLGHLAVTQPRRDKAEDPALSRAESIGRAVASS
jgi:CheY-like chemotaxis protein